jgi:hypothetical protein
MDFNVLIGRGERILSLLRDNPKCQDEYKVLEPEVVSSKRVYDEAWDRIDNMGKDINDLWKLVQ